MLCFSISLGAIQNSIDRASKAILPHHDAIGDKARTVVGEGAFFSHRTRSATVQANGACRLRGLTPLRFAELSNRQPAAALALAMMVGAVLAKRLANRRMRVAAT